MKKILGIAVITAVVGIGSIDAKAGKAEPYCPVGAPHTRLDMKNTTPETRTATGSWVEVNRHAGGDNAGAWGNSVCADPGSSCSPGDWFTWWYDPFLQPPFPQDCQPGSDLHGLVPVGLDEQKNYILTPDQGE